MWLVVEVFLQGAGLLVVMLMVLAVIFCVWCFCRAYSVCSASANSEGIAQSFLFHEGKLLVRINVKWDQVQKAWWSSFSYYSVLV
jgi:hypothetical protein